MSSWQVPGYQDIRELTPTATGRTVQARHAITGTPVSISYLSDDLRHDEAWLGSYRAKARVFADLDSPFLARVYEYVEGDAGAALVREEIRGAPLSAILLAHGQLDPRSALTVLKGGLQAIAAAHAAGTAHGDYRADNLYIQGDGTTKLSDFTASPGVVISEAAEIAAALGVFVACLGGPAATGRLPKGLRSLPETVTAQAAQAAVAHLDQVATKVYGASWEAKGHRQLAKWSRRHAEPAAHH